MTIEKNLGYSFYEKNLLNRALTRKAYALEQERRNQNCEYVLAETLEALIGAIYLDGGYEASKDVITKWFKFWQ
jgi:dsRNA-specific ribonuclease